MQLTAGVVGVGDGVGGSGVLVGVAVGVAVGGSGVSVGVAVGVAVGAGGAATSKGDRLVTMPQTRPLIGSIAVVTSSQTPSS